MGKGLDLISIFKRSFGLLCEAGYREQAKNRGSFQEAFSVVKARNDWLLTRVEGSHGWIVIYAGLEGKS